MDERLLDEMTRSERGSVMVPIGEALTSEARDALEIERVFARNQTAFLLACELPDAGDARPLVASLKIKTVVVFPAVDLEG